MPLAATGLAAVVLACSPGDDGLQGRSAAAAAAGAAGVAGSGSAGGVVAGEPDPACPATGLWTQCALVKRLERAGLVPLVDSAPVTEPPLSVHGFLVRLGRGELEVYLYPDAAGREREQALLDTARYVGYTAPLLGHQATLIASGNALAVFHSRNDHQRERVGDAITAGAPMRAP
jgi:hypothetical protein